MRTTTTCRVLVLLSLQSTLYACGGGEPTITLYSSEAQGGQSGSSTAEDVAGSGSEKGGSGTGGVSTESTEAAPAKTAIPLTPNSDLSVFSTSNDLGIQGTWTPIVGTDSTLTITAADGNMCLNGMTAVVPLIADTQYDYAKYSGAAASFDLCRSGASDEPANTVYPLGSCPLAPTLAQSLSGVRFTVAEGAAMPRELRVVFKEKDRETSAYVVVSAAGQATALVADASVASDSSAAPVNVSQLESIQIYAFPSRRSSYEFSVCISSFEVLTGSGWSALPDWISEPGPGMKVKYAGVNLSCAEFGQQNLPGTYGTDYIYPSSADIDIYANVHMNVIRLPFRWERLQRTLGGDFDATELSRLKTTVDYAVKQGMSVILDPHNYGRYGDAVIGTDVDIADFAAFWGRLAELYAGNDKVFFGLMNEPHDMPSTESWLEASNAAIAAIRHAGAKNLVLVPGNAWTGAHNWAATYYGTPNSTVMTGIVDEGNNFAFELHQYLDGDSSGTSATCVSGTIGSERVTQVTDWLRTNKYQGFLGEFNGGANATCYEAIDDLVTFVGENSDVWMGWAVWAGGPWWGENILTVQPRANGKERPQMTVLKRHLPSE